MGVVYYQRLRHVVSDKFQVQTTGPIDVLTHQPIKGHKRAGGIRFGEMERDSLLAHGSSFLLQDRLLNCSDRSFVSRCTPIKGDLGRGGGNGKVEFENINHNTLANFVGPYASNRHSPLR